MIFKQTTNIEQIEKENIFILYVDKGDMSPFKDGDILLMKNSDINIGDTIITKNFSVELYKGQPIIGKIVAKYDDVNRLSTICKQSK